MGGDLTWFEFWIFQKYCPSLSSFPFFKTWSSITCIYDPTDIFVCTWLWQIQHLPTEAWPHPHPSNYYKSPHQFKAQWLYSLKDIKVEVQGLPFHQPQTDFTQHNTSQGATDLDELQVIDSEMGM